MSIISEKKIESEHQNTHHLDSVLIPVKPVRLLPWIQFCSICRVEAVHMDSFQLNTAADVVLETFPDRQWQLTSRNETAREMASSML